MEKEEYKDLEQEITPEPTTYEELCKIKTESEITEEFLTKYRALVRLYHRDFVQEPPKVVKLNFAKK